jgi:hypothetical protein
MNKAMQDVHGVIGESIGNILTKHLLANCSERERELLVIYREYFGARIAKFSPEMASDYDKAMLPLVQELCDKNNLSVLLELCEYTEGYEYDGKFYEITICN